MGHADRAAAPRVAGIPLLVRSVVERVGVLAIVIHPHAREESLVPPPGGLVSLPPVGKERSGWRRAVSTESDRAHRESKPMTKPTLTASTNTNLNKQGFGNLVEDAKLRLRWPLRFTPAVSIALVAVGLALRSPVWLGSMALVALSGALFPYGMLIDLLYNFGFRHLISSPALPPTPKPRQFSYLLSFLLLATSAFAFAQGLPIPGLVLGGSVVVGGAILTSTLWCLGSWIYRQLFRRSATVRSPSSLSPSKHDHVGGASGAQRPDPSVPRHRRE